MDTKSVYPISHADVLQGMNDQLRNIRWIKSQAGTSDQARALAVSATELEKVIAYYQVFAAGGSIEQAGSN